MTIALDPVMPLPGGKTHGETRCTASVSGKRVAFRLFAARFSRNRVPAGSLPGRAREHGPHLNTSFQDSR